MSAQKTRPSGGSILTSLLGVLGMSGIAGVLVAAMVTPLFAVAGVAANSTITLFESLPNYLEITPLQAKTTVYANQGGQQVTIAEFYAQNREEVSLDQISQYVKDAAVATEDPRFYEHGGVDVISAARAVLNSVISDADAGASTIPMQYVRNMRVQKAESILDPEARATAYEEATETTIARKLQEMRLAIGVDKQYSKDEILQGYLNVALFGGTTYGIEAAAQRYFSKSAADLTLPEAASLIAMVQEPNAYRLDVAENIPANQDRRDYVLYRMLNEKKITQEEYDAAVATPVTPVITDSTVGCANAAANTQYFCNYVRAILLTDSALGSTEDERRFNLETKGYEIHTTIDLDAQQQAQQVMNDAVPSSREDMELGGAATMVENGTGRILAMVQNTQFPTEAVPDGPGVTEVNYNVPEAYGESGGFQPGSTYKIFTLAEWLATGHSLGSTVDARTRQFSGASFQNSCEAMGGTYTPENDGGSTYSRVTALEATRLSINTAFFAMASQLDLCRIRDTAKALGVEDARSTHALTSVNLSDVIGSGENQVAPLSMATALSGLANGGVKCAPVAIDSITLRDGTPVAAPATSCTQAVSADVAAGVNAALEATATSGTASRSNPGIVPMTGKTGSTDSYEQTWMVGATTEVGLAVWVGNVSAVDGVKQNLTRITLPEASGSNTRHVVFNGIISYAMNTYGGGDFAEPSAELTRPDYVTVPDLAGRTTEEAKQVLEGLGFSVSIGAAAASDRPAGTVASTVPTGGTSVTSGVTVTITPSSGQATAGTVQMPNLVGLTADEATAQLLSAGFNSGTLTQHSETNATVAEGTILRTDPVAGTSVPSTSDVDIYVAKP